MNPVRTHPIRRITPRILLGMSLWPGLALSGGLLNGQAPDGPPEIEPTPFQTFNPEPLGNRIIPPFYAADPGSTLLAVGQMVELMVVMSHPDGAEVHWIKNDQTLPDETKSSLHIDEVSELDGGNYRVEVTIDGTAVPSSNVNYQVLSLAEIDDVLESWSNRFFTFEEMGDPEISGETADPDLDGLSNLIEYFFGLNPTQSSAPPELKVTGSIDSTVSFSYSRTRERKDTKVTVEGSNGLNDWVPLSVTETTVLPIDETTERVEVESDWPFDPPFPRFLRLVIEEADF